MDVYASVYFKHVEVYICNINQCSLLICVCVHELSKQYIKLHQRVAWQLLMNWYPDQ